MRVVAKALDAADKQADSGNGAHLLYRLDLPNDADAKRLVDGCMKSLAQRFTDSQVPVDTTVGNAARIWKLYLRAARQGFQTGWASVYQVLAHR